MCIYMNKCKIHVNSRPEISKKNCLKFFFNPKYLERYYVSILAFSFDKACFFSQRNPKGRSSISSL